MTKDQAVAALNGAVSDTISKIVFNIVGDLTVDKDMGEALRRFSVGLHHARKFHDGAMNVIDGEFK